MSGREPITTEIRAKLAEYEPKETGDAFVTRPVGRTGYDAMVEMCDAIDAVHANLERENAELKAEHEGDWIKLPVDADGLPIHVGDVMVYAETKLCPKKVEAIVSSAVFLTDEGPRYADMCRHQPDSWEHIIEDALGSRWSAPNELSRDFTALVARCKKLAGDAE